MGQTSSIHDSSRAPRKGFNGREETGWGLHEPRKICVEDFPTNFISMGFPVCYIFLDISSKNLSSLHSNPREFCVSTALLRSSTVHPPSM